MATASAGRSSSARAAGAVVLLVLVVGKTTEAGALSADDDRTFTVAGLTFVSSDRPWHPDERATITATVVRLPAMVAGQKLIVERVGTPCQPDGLPADDLLFDPAHGQARLCSGQTFDLARQVALTVWYAFESATRWSAREDWRRLNGWRAALSRGGQPAAENIAPEAFLPTDARTSTATAAIALPTRATRSPRWELVAVAAALSLDQATGDDRVACRLLSQATFLRARLADGGPSPEAPTDCGGFERWAALDRLADVEIILAAPSSAMVGSLFGHLLLRLRYRDDLGETPLDLERAIGFLADNDTPYRDDPTYAIKGIFGAYAASLHERPFLTSYRDYVALEGRDLRRWRLHLSEAERRALLERIWTLAQGGRYRYYFFARNCATLLVDLINSALPPAGAVQIPGLLAAPPSSILERFEGARTADGAPRVSYLPEPILALEHRARLASERRQGVARRLLRAGAGDATAALAVALQQTSAPADPTRAAGYRALASLLARPDVAQPDDVYQYLRDSAALESHLSVLANQQGEERAHADRRQRLQRAVEDLLDGLRAAGERLARDSDPSLRDSGHRLILALAAIADAEPARRMDGYQALREDLPRLIAQAPTTAARARLLVLLQSEVRYDVTRMKAAPGLRDALLFVDADRPIEEQPYLTSATWAALQPGEARALLQQPSQTQVSAALRALQQTKQLVFAARHLQPSPRLLAGEDDTPAAGTLARAYAGALPRSGIDQLAVLGAVDAGSATTSGGGRRFDAGLVLAGALYDEQLGDHRRFGFPSHTALVVARSAALMVWSPSPSSLYLGVARYDARLVGYRSLPPRLAEGGGVRGPSGWEIALDLRGSRAQSLTAATSALGGFIWRLWERDELADHLLLRAGLSLEAQFPNAGAAYHGHPLGAGAPLGLEYRRRLGPADQHRSYLALQLFGGGTWMATGAPVSVASNLGAAAATHLALRRHSEGGAHDPALLIAAQFQRSSFTPARPGPATEATSSVGIELR